VFCSFPQGSYGQSEIITQYFFADLTGKINTTDIDECANNSINACQNHNCTDGYNPPYGYTCRKPTGELLQVDYISKKFYDGAVDLGGFPIAYIKDIIIDTTANTIIYVYGLTRALNSVELFLLGSAPNLISTNSEANLGFKLHPSRILVTSDTSPAITIKFLFPTLAVTVSWLSDTNGDLQLLQYNSLTAVGLNASSTGAQVRDVTLYSNGTVMSKWIEDMTKAPGTDTSYITLGCTFVGLLLNGSIDIASTGFKFDAQTLMTTDGNCQYFTGGGNPNVPASMPSSSPPPGSSTGPNTGPQTGLTGAAFTIVPCFGVVLVFILMLLRDE
jgi:hypothetical protein